MDTPAADTVTGSVKLFDIRHGTVPNAISPSTFPPGNVEISI
jgi:hypothetical protein